jgi:hypothetical protein
MTWLPNYPLSDAVEAFLGMFEIPPEYLDTARMQLLTDCGLGELQTDQLDKMSCTEEQFNNFRHVLGLKPYEDIPGQLELHVGEHIISYQSLKRPMEIPRFSRPRIVEGTAIKLNSYEHALMLLSNSDEKRVRDLTKIGFPDSMALQYFSSYLKELTNVTCEPIVIWRIADGYVYASERRRYINQTAIPKYCKLFAEIVHSEEGIYMTQAWVQLTFGCKSISLELSASTTESETDSTSDETFDQIINRWRTQYDP